jgi:putative flippase GtrA
MKIPISDETITNGGLAKLRGQLLRFVAVGGSNLLLTYVLYLLLLFIASPVIAILIANAVGIIFTATLNIRLVFAKHLSGASVSIMTLYLTLYSIAYAAMLDFVIRFFSIPAVFAPFPVACVMIPIQFLCSKFLVVWVTPK